MSEYIKSRLKKYGLTVDSSLDEVKPHALSLLETPAGIIEAMELIHKRRFDAKELSQENMNYMLILLASSAEARFDIIAKMKDV